MSSSPSRRNFCHNQYPSDPKRLHVVHTCVSRSQLRRTVHNIHRTATGGHEACVRAPCQVQAVHDYMCTILRRSSTLHAPVHRGQNGGEQHAYKIPRCAAVLWLYSEGVLSQCCAVMLFAAEVHPVRRQGHWRDMDEEEAEHLHPCTHDQTTSAHDTIMPVLGSDPKLLAYEVR